MLEQKLDRLGLAPAIMARQLAVVAVDMTDPLEPRVAAVNGDHMMYAASLPKIGILLAAFHDIGEGRLTLDSATRDSLTRMIRVSSNTEATRMLNQVGKRRINKILKSSPYRLYDPLVNGGLWVGKEYATGTAFERDPLHNISHGATAMQTARFYYLLDRGRLASPALTREMKSMLAEPEIDHKFVKALRKRPVRLYRKSGTWRHYHADSVMVESALPGERGKYVLVALAQDPDGGRWLTRIAEEMHDQLMPTRLTARR
ncbi:MAG: class A beta-lactamase-related serine hydrolase [Gammaproteobacteria bacterium]|nr:class A beta-lactamase-related serine hydrolase [Gammaproteobacteria bacterium]